MLAHVPGATVGVAHRGVATTDFNEHLREACMPSTTRHDASLPQTILRVMNQAGGFDDDVDVVELEDDFALQQASTRAASGMTVQPPHQR